MSKASSIFWTLILLFRRQEDETGNHEILFVFAQIARPKTEQSLISDFVIFERKEALLAEPVILFDQGVLKNEQRYFFALAFKVDLVDVREQLELFIREF